MNNNFNNCKDILELINTLKDEKEIVDFVHERINVLENNSFDRTLCYDNNGRGIGTINSGYINSNSRIVTSWLVEPFYMDDINIYVEFIKYIQGKELPGIIDFIYELQSFINKNFGYKGDSKARINFYADMTENRKKISISDFLQKNIALCSEQCAVVQNLAEFFMIKSYYVIGNLISDKSVPHVYNIFSTQNGTLILYDVTNPVELKNGGVALAINIIGKENIENVERIKFDFDFIQKNYGEIEEKELARERIYETCNYELNKVNSGNKKI